MLLCSLAAARAPATPQIDQERAATYFKEAAALREREGGRLWGVSLCGPMVIADAAIRTIATNQRATLRVRRCWGTRTPPSPGATSGRTRAQGRRGKRDVEPNPRVAELRRRFVEGPVVTLPRGRNATFTSTGMTPIPGAGTIYPRYRVNAEWGTLEAATVLVSPDGSTPTLPGPARAEGMTIAGADWTITLAAGWVLRPGARAGDSQVERQAR